MCIYIRVCNASFMDSDGAQYSSVRTGAALIALHCCSAGFDGAQFRFLALTRLTALLRALLLQPPCKIWVNCRYELAPPFQSERARRLDAFCTERGSEKQCKRLAGRDSDSQHGFSTKVGGWELGSSALGSRISVSASTDQEQNAPCCACTPKSSTALNVWWKCSFMKQPLHSHMADTRNALPMSAEHRTNARHA